MTAQQYDDALTVRADQKPVQRLQKRQINSPAPYCSTHAPRPPADQGAAARQHAGRTRPERTCQFRLAAQKHDFSHAVDSLVHQFIQSAHLVPRPTRVGELVQRNEIKEPAFSLYGPQRLREFKGGGEAFLLLSFARARKRTRSNSGGRSVRRVLAAGGFSVAMECMIDGALAPENGRRLVAAR